MARSLPRTGADRAGRHARDPAGGRIITRRRALVIGGSVGGLFAASLLRAQGWDATVFERSTGDLAGRGAGVGMTRELLDAMIRVGAKIDPSIGVPVASTVWLGADGAIRYELPRRMVAGAWARIYRPLRRVYPNAHYRAGKALARIEQDATSVTAIFSDGTHESGDVLIAADGSQSTVRRQFLPDVEPRYAGYVAWRGVIDEHVLPPATRALLDRSIPFSFHERELMLTIATPAFDDDVATATGRRCYFIWYRPTESETALRDLFTDAGGRDHGSAIPPTSIRAEHVAALKTRAAAIFAPAIAEVVARTDQPLLQAITDLESPALVFGRVVLLGDSAFVARPHVAGGITKAALDAEALAEALAEAGDDLAPALARYDRERRDFGTQIVAHARLLGNYIERDAARAGEPHHFDPKWIMREYGAPHLLHEPDLSRYGAAGVSSPQ